MGLFNLFSQKKALPTNSIKPIVLLILDGFGVAPPSEGNAISMAKKPNIDKLFSMYPNTLLTASGESVGLPANEVGNTEVGHLTIGAGRMIPQSLKRITMSIEDGSFFENRALQEAYNHVKKNNSNLHIMGLVGSGNVHSSVSHLYKLLDFYARYKPLNLYLHLFTDGRDSPPKEGEEIISKIEDYLKSIRVGSIASVAGRYWAMDRDRRWDRIQKAYEALTLGKGLTASSAIEAVKASYAKGQTDEFVEPTLVVKDGKPAATINDNDAVVFFNFRIDRPRQLTMAFTMPDFENLKGFELGYIPDEGKVQKEIVKGSTFKREKVVKNLFFATMTEYQKGLPVSAVAYPPPNVVNPLSEVLTQNNISHMHMAESEKERMVTFYFDGLRDNPFPLENSIIVPSPKIATYDKKPEMNIFGIISEFKKAIEKNEYKFFVINFANPDMVAHTGNLEATIKAIEATDKAIGEMTQKVLEYDGTLIITADHGNAEDLLSYPTTSFFYTTSGGEMNTDHSNNPVPMILIKNGMQPNSVVLNKGALSDIAPTILTLMGLPIPPEMQGKSLIVAK